MNYASRLGIAVCLVWGVLLPGQNGPSSSDSKSATPAANPNEIDITPPQPRTTEGAIDILTDTRGVDFGPYLAQLVKTVREHWYGVIPASARPPLSRKGVVLVRFRIMKDGKVADLHYVESSGDADLDQAVHDGIAASDPFPPLPKEFVCEYVALQLGFYYNPDMHSKQVPLKRVPADRQPLPCVTTSVRTIGEVVVRVLPNSANVATGARQQFSAVLTGTEKSAVTWSVKGAGCAALACGSISADGLYTAPSGVPEPPQITVTGALTSDPKEADSVTVTIVKSKTPP